MQISLIPVVLGGIKTPYRRRKSRIAVNRSSSLRLAVFFIVSGSWRRVLPSSRVRPAREMSVCAPCPRNRGRGGRRQTTTLPFVSVVPFSNSQKSIFSNSFDIPALAVKTIRKKLLFANSLPPPARVASFPFRSGLRRGRGRGRANCLKARLHTFVCPPARPLCSQAAVF